jgi:multidrug efflux pump subunit AcrA (membrane-fusion protein)
MTKRNLLIGGGILTLVVIGYFIIKSKKTGDTTELLATARKGEFRIGIETTGELEAKKSVKILGPTTLSNFSIWNVTIQNIVDEGTLVKKGDWIATLDKSELQNKFNQKQIELEKSNSRFVQTQLDTTLQMRQSRDELINLKYAVDEKDIVLQQSKFEPPATIKQSEINLDKAKRAYEQAVENYKIKRNQSVEKMREVAAELKKVQQEFGSMKSTMETFDVKAPEDGMVIYEKGWDGKPIKSGSQISVWEPTVATLPDLTRLQSKTYVNEVDIRKVKIGQKVNIGLDAYPDKKLKGVVTKVANVGEQRPNSDAKVFLVSVEIDGEDPTLRPSMTTSNSIIQNVIKDATYIPLECLHSRFDSITFVYKKVGLKTVRQEVIIGETNSNDAIVLAGVQPEEQLYLSMPGGVDEGEVLLLPQLNGKRKKKEVKEPEKKDTVAGKPLSSL